MSWIQKRALTNNNDADCDPGISDDTHVDILLSINTEIRRWTISAALPGLPACHFELGIALSDQHSPEDQTRAKVQPRPPTEPDMRMLAREPDSGCGLKRLMGRFRADIQ